MALVPKAAADLQFTHERTRLSKTDIVNRAISLYEFIDAELTDGATPRFRECVEVGQRETIVVLRDFKQPHGTLLHYYAAADWGNFVRRIKAGQLDGLGVIILLHGYSEPRSPLTCRLSEPATVGSTRSRPPRLCSCPSATNSILFRSSSTP